MRFADLTVSAFLDALSGTGSAVSVVDVSTTATQQVPYTTVTEDSIAKVFAPYLENGYVPNGWTNWEAAFRVVKQPNERPGGPKAAVSTACGWPSTWDIATRWPEAWHCSPPRAAVRWRPVRSASTLVTR